MNIFILLIFYSLNVDAAVSVESSMGSGNTTKTFSVDDAGVMVLQNNGKSCKTLEQVKSLDPGATSADAFYNSRLSNYITLQGPEETANFFSEKIEFRRINYHTGTKNDTGIKVARGEDPKLLVQFAMSVFCPSKQLASKFSHFANIDYARISKQGDLVKGQEVAAITNTFFPLIFEVDRDGITMGPGKSVQGYSDLRLKNNVNQLQYGLETIKKLDPKSFNFIHAEDKRLHFGFIAQDFIKLVPELVSQDPKDQLYSINYTGMIPILTNAVKELNEDRVKLEEKVEALELKLLKLEKMLEER